MTQPHAILQRCFIGLEPDDEILDALIDLQHRIHGTGKHSESGIRWIARSDLHVTLRFLGVTTDVQRVQIADALLAASENLPAVDVNGGTYWRSTHGSHVLVLLLAMPPSLRDLASRMEALAVAAGFLAERRPFRAHITLAKLSSRAARSPWPDIAPAGALPACGFRALTLFSSQPATADSHSGTHYRRLASKEISKDGYRSD
ncbi:RNA 2',3'-cyclic phosphodiesterase [Glaciimonas soli]|uniref:RNA 2',3'-cyclic phosphodiesterase n=1 Tax=Glaciimonas soli TaxID=2590999 RepID=A0A843YTG5_9BURK|nr:RNA 2',3'-cyclic phosphodiesterase [Glaciimonas soli]MQR01297.1 RNA 2',3'-cyclic phosphodiesterase [Glaciimonas soli]